MKIITYIFIFSLTMSSLYANCGNKLFSFSINSNKHEKVSIADVLNQISNTCNVSIVYQDAGSKKKVKKILHDVNIHNFTFEELLDFLLNDNNLFYQMSNNGKILKVSYIKTKSFYIDYVSFTSRKSTTNKVIKTGSGGGTSNNTNNTNNINNINNTNNTTGGGDTTTMDFTSDFKFWSKIQNDVNSILKRESVPGEKKETALVSQDAGVVTVTGTKKQLEGVQKYLNIIIKRLHKQILIEAKIIEVTFNKDKTTGINWSKFSLGLSARSDAQKSRGLSSLGAVSEQNYQPIANGFLDTLKHPNYLVGYSFTMDGLIKFLKTQGDVSVVSNPKIMTLNNQSAIINVGTEVNYRYDSGSTTTTSSGGTTTTPNYTTSSTFVGVTLDITPQVTKNNYIILKINPVVSSIAATHINADGVPFLAPDIKVKQLSSIVMVKNNSKILIGGLISKTKGTTNTSVPILSSIPIIGNAFKSSSKNTKRSELIMVIIPHIIKGSNSISLNKYDNKFIRSELAK